ncbi:MAG: leucyl/phenylalanyl-tRNA--protein transferase [Actinomycetota bacterium]
MVGGDLAPGTLLLAYRSGLFPMPHRRRLAWFSPDPRAVLPAGGVHVARSLRRTLARFRITVDTEFRHVVESCGDPRRPSGWITRDIIDAYCKLHALGWAHSVEVWSEERLVGGLYGVGIGAFFAGESMFHRVTGASKVAMIATDRIVGSVRGSLFDVQWATDHLRMMGVVEVSRAAYLSRLAPAVDSVGPDWSAEVDLLDPAP